MGSTEMEVLAPRDIAPDEGARLCRYHMQRVAAGVWQAVESLGAIDQGQLWRFIGYESRDQFLREELAKFLPLHMAKRYIVLHQKLQGIDEQERMMLTEGELKVLSDVAVDPEVMSVQYSAGKVLLEDGTEQSLDDYNAQKSLEFEEIAKKANKRVAKSLRSLEDKNRALAQRLEEQQRIASSKIDNLETIIARIADERGVAAESLAALTQAQNDVQLISAVCTQAATLLRTLVQRVEQTPENAGTLQHNLGIVRVALTDIEEHWSGLLFDLPAEDGGEQD